MQGFFLNDEPTIEDRLQRTRLVEKTARRILDCNPPMAFGVHGDWGSGKTSFLHLLYFYLTGEYSLSLSDSKKVSKKDYKKKYKDNFKQNLEAPEVEVVWFEAWRYQNEKTPIIALLNEIRSHLSLVSKFKGRLNKMTEVTIRGALVSLEDLTKKIGIQASKIQAEGEKWEKAHFAYSLPSESIRSFLQNAIRDIIKDKKLVVIIDDLDRCESESAYTLLEGIKIYLNLNNTIFVLGMNQKIIQGAIAKSLPDTHKPLERQHQAVEYLEKICPVIVHLPLVRDSYNYFAYLLKEHVSEENADKTILEPQYKAFADIAQRYECLPANPRKIKAFTNTFIRFIEEVEKPSEEKQRMTLMAMAYLYQFFHELYKRVESDPRFFNNVIEWCTEGESRHEFLENIILPASAAKTVSEEAGKTPKKELELIPSYPEPGDPRIFHIQKLLQDIGDVPTSTLQNYILHDV